nr:MAG TPA: hypothetical protein [Ackermannviridae sp.]
MWLLFSRNENFLEFFFVLTVGENKGGGYLESVM